MKLNIALILFLCLSLTAIGQTWEKPDDLVEQEGYFNFLYSEQEGKIFLEVDKVGTDFLYAHYLTSGLGSNDIGLDRGQLGGEAIVRFEKAGNKLLLVQPNQEYRAETENQLEKSSVEQAFAHSVLQGFEIKEQNGDTYTIDLTPFLMQDAQGVSIRLKRGNNGNYSISKEKSFLAMERTKAFPENVEFEATLTFQGEPQGRAIRSVAPDPGNLSLTQHLSFIKLPDDNYKKRPFDPRSGAISISYMDYSTPVFEPITKRYIIRHRLEKKDPNAGLSEPVEPIVYYLDPGTPEPVKSALLDGAKWWNEAYEEIGYKDAFQVKMLPDDADPLDIRYNVIQWVHRSTRGWSYGASVVDPRTGEILKGHVSLGSLRIRQDFMIAQALMNKPFAQRDDDHDAMMEMAIARIRQLSAHEVGHTIGFAHNFAASVSSNASVMDYPHPQFELNNGEIDLSNAYDAGIGEWDKITVKYSYGDVPNNTSEEEYLNEVLEEARDKGFQFISDSDARAQGGAHADAHLWDNGENPSQELRDVLEIREKAISNFSVDNIRTREAYSVLEDVFVPLYFFHRYQTEAAVKRIGGLRYTYAVKGGGDIPVETLDKQAQEEALQAILATMDPETLAIPKDKLELFPPRAFGYSRSRESFKSNTGVAFDALGAPAIASDMTLSLLLNNQRAARLVQQKALDQDQLGLEEVLEELLDKTIRSTQQDPYLQEVQQAVNFNVLRHVMGLAVHQNSTPRVKAITSLKIDELENWLIQNEEKNKATHRLMLKEIERFREHPEVFRVTPDVPQIPDGSPIGSFNLNNK